MKTILTFYNLSPENDNLPPKRSNYLLKRTLVL